LFICLDLLFTCSQKLSIIWFSNLLDMNVSDESYFMNASTCALYSIFTFV
jgi:hypothetical protein